MFGGYKHCGSGDIMILRLSRDVTKPREQMVMRLFWQEPIKVSYHSAKSGGFSHPGNGDIMF